MDDPGAEWNFHWGPIPASTWAGMEMARKRSFRGK
jgi:hypothetical protein